MHNRVFLFFLLKLSAYRIKKKQQIPLSRRPLEPIRTPQWWFEALVRILRLRFWFWNICPFSFLLFNRSYLFFILPSLHFHPYPFLLTFPSIHFLPYFSFHTLPSLHFLPYSFFLTFPSIPFLPYSSFLTFPSFPSPMLQFSTPCPSPAKTSSPLILSPPSFIPFAYPFFPLPSPLLQSSIPLSTPHHSSPITLSIYVLPPVVYWT